MVSPVRNGTGNISIFHGKAWVVWPSEVQSGKTVADMATFGW